MINAKIEVPDDDNYSDDELTFLPYYTYLDNNFDPEKVKKYLSSGIGLLKLNSASL
jgi:hypothetical protein